ncbi:MAG: hypothetical protein ACOYUZ_03025 [Patescibacteria group bacterium]
MIKKNSIIPHDKPVYREVIPQALVFAWKHPMHWLLGVFAAILFSGGSLDVMWNFWNSVKNQGTELFIGNTLNNLWLAASLNSANGINWLPFIKGLLILVFFFVIIVAVAAFACICQGALVYAIGSWKDKRVTILKSLYAGAHALIPIAILNLIIIIFLWIARFGVSFPLAIALGKNNTLFVSVYIVSFIVFTVLALGFSVLQIYSLNAIILQKAGLAKSLQQGWEMIKKHWLVTLETAILQSLVVLLILAAAAVATTLIVIPTIVTLYYTLENVNFLLFQIVAGVFIAVAVIIITLLSGYIVAFQYAIWTFMFKKFGEGGVMPKLHRIFRSFIK